ncbi:uncharacterized protein IWZ02DRAFT_515372 [Phyllosticta citriasiana]|uniref:uncharacterized protein n=1 Tax=Phyllosticta citriasiana TaxID=595635 RepID=UPI0030FD3C66
MTENFYPGYQPEGNTAGKRLEAGTRNMEGEEASAKLDEGFAQEAGLRIHDLADKRKKANETIAEYKNINVAVEQGIALRDFTESTLKTATEASTDNCEKRIEKNKRQAGGDYQEIKSLREKTSELDSELSLLKIERNIWRCEVRTRILAEHDECSALVHDTDQLRQKMFLLPNCCSTREWIIEPFDEWEGPGMVALRHLSNKSHVDEQELQKIKREHVLLSDLVRSGTKSDPPKESTDADSTLRGEILEPTLEPLEKHAPLPTMHGLETTPGILLVGSLRNQLEHQKGRITSLSNEAEGLHRSQALLIDLEYGSLMAMDELEETPAMLLFKSLQNQLASAHKTISELKGKLGAAGDSEAQFLKENNVLHRLVHSSARSAPAVKFEMPEQSGPDLQLEPMTSTGKLDELIDMEESPAIMLVQSASKELQTLRTQVEEKDEELAELKKERTMLVELVQRGQLDYPPQSFDLESAATSLQGLPIGTLTPEDRTLPNIMEDDLGNSLPSRLERLVQQMQQKTKEFDLVCRMAQSGEFGAPSTTFDASTEMTFDFDVAEPTPSSLGSIILEDMDDFDPGKALRQALMSSVQTLDQWVSNTEPELETKIQLLQKFLRDNHAVNDINDARIYLETSTDTVQQSLDSLEEHMTQWSPLTPHEALPTLADDGIGVRLAQTVQNLFDDLERVNGIYDETKDQLKHQQKLVTVLFKLLQAFGRHIKHFWRSNVDMDELDSLFNNVQQSISDLESAAPGESEPLHRLPDILDHPNILQILNDAFTTLQHRLEDSNSLLTAMNVDSARDLDTRFEAMKGQLDAVQTFTGDSSIRDSYRIEDDMGDRLVDIEKLSKEVTKQSAASSTMLRYLASRTKTEISSFQSTGASISEATSHALEALDHSTASLGEFNPNDSRRLQDLVEWNEVALENVIIRLQCIMMRCDWRSGETQRGDQEQRSLVFPHRGQRNLCCHSSGGKETVVGEFFWLDVHMKDCLATSSMEHSLSSMVALRELSSTTAVTSGKLIKVKALLAKLLQRYIRNWNMAGMVVVDGRAGA